MKSSVSETKIISDKNPGCYNLWQDTGCLVSRIPTVCVYFDIIHMDYQKCSLEYDIVIWLGKGQLSPEYSIIEMFCFVMPAHIEQNLDRPASRDITIYGT